MRTINDYLKTSNFIEKRLEGYQLDSFRVYSIEIQICFVREGDVENGAVWVSAMEDIVIKHLSDTYYERSQVVSRLYELIGSRVSDAKILENGALCLKVDRETIIISSSDHLFEVSWAITPKTPEPYLEHDWSVAFTDDLELILTASS